ncbi:MAG TPA: septal ring lytic transglycosylase RlpA family protein [Stellaceae bacterium]|nr:septal ring lytic transglycosylase RlpA family protein [Stellaceae bacterium]
MIRRTVQHLAVLALLAALAACAGRTSAPPATSEGGATYKIGKPYQIDGIWYYPAVDWTYNETGIASWYGKEFSGKYTADGEVFDLNALTAAHRTLPLPSVVQVTNLENGRSIELRVNDRGPFARGRIIDVSRRAAQLLGFEQQGTAKVQVKILVPESIQVAALAGGGRFTPPDPAHAAPVAPVLAQSLTQGAGTRVASFEPPAVPVSRPAPPPPAPMLTALPPATEKVTVVPVKATQIYIQAGAFAVAGNAQRVKGRLQALGNVKVTGARINGVALYRVRLGPIGNVEDADKLLDRVLATGLSDARIVVD